MKFILKTAVYSIFLSIIIISCCKKRNYNFLLSDEDLKWNPYKQGQQLSFKSNLQDTEFFEVSKVSRVSYPESGITSDCMGISREVLSVVIQSDSNGGGTIDIIATYDDSPTSAKIRWANLYYGYTEHPFNYLPPEPPSNTMVINGITYNNVYEINKENPPVDSAWIKYYFNKDYGFLKYVLKNGKYYELIK